MPVYTDTPPSPQRACSTVVREVGRETQSSLEIKSSVSVSISSPNVLLHFVRNFIAVEHFEKAR